jgi:hypothetical protein
VSTEQIKLGVAGQEIFAIVPRNEPRADRGEANDGKTPNNCLSEPHFEQFLHRALY